MAERPGGALAKRPLQFIWLVDCSGSMTGAKIAAVNLAIREVIQPMRDIADENPNADVLVRAIKFSDGAQWHVAQPTNIHDFKWTDLNTNGTTDMGRALLLLADAMKVENMPQRGLPPVLVLMSDGYPTDDFATGLAALMKEPWGAKAVRIAIAIGGEDAGLDVLQKFIGHDELKPLVAEHAADLVNMIRWASTVPLKAATNPATVTPGAQGGPVNVPIPAPPTGTAPMSPADVF